MKAKRPARYKRLHKLLQNQWASSLTIIYNVGTVSPSKATSELRAKGVEIKTRLRADGVREYRCAR